MTSKEIDNSFKKYADFSVRADRYFNWVNAMISHFPGMKFIHGLAKDVKEENFAQDPVSTLAFNTINFFNYFETTGVFKTDAFSDNEIDDTRNFSYYTCYCFQWTLFENFITDSMFSAAKANLFPAEIGKEILKCDTSKKLFDLLESGKVFGNSPFIAMLPEKGWQPGIAEYDFKDLEQIRKKRNSYIHGNIDAGISPEHIMKKQSEYELTMWILRKFSESICFRLKNILQPES